MREDKMALQQELKDIEDYILKLERDPALARHNRELIISKEARKNEIIGLLSQE